MLQTCKQKQSSKKISCQVPGDSPEKFQGPIAVGMGPQKADKIQGFLFVRFRALQLWKTEREFVDWIFTYLPSREPGNISHLGKRKKH